MLTCNQRSDRETRGVAAPNPVQWQQDAGDPNAACRDLVNLTRKQEGMGDMGTWI